MIRIVRGSSATLSATFYADENPRDLDGAPTVTVTRQDGTQTVTDATTARTALGTYTLVLAPQTQLTVLELTWTGMRDGIEVTCVTYAEVVGAEYFSISELRDFDTVLRNTTKFPTEKLIQARLAVASEFEGICGRSFVPRYAWEEIYGDGTGMLWLSHPEPLRTLSCTVNGEDWSDRELRRVEHNIRTVMLPHGQTWPRDQPIVIEYEYGMTEVPVRIKIAAMKRAKYQLVADQSRIDERATTMNIPDFGNFILATPGLRGSYTGIPEVDVVLADYELS